MNIQSTIERKNGTEVDIDGEIYHFKPHGKDLRHTCNVKKRAHLAKFLTIPEAYCIADEGDVDEADVIIEETETTEANPLNLSIAEIEDLMGNPEKEVQLNPDGTVTVTDLVSGEEIVYGSNQEPPDDSGDPGVKTGIPPAKAPVKKAAAKKAPAKKAGTARTRTRKKT